MDFGRVHCASDRNHTLPSIIKHKGILLKLLSLLFQTNGDHVSKLGSQRFGDLNCGENPWEDGEEKNPNIFDHS